MGPPSAIERELSDYVGHPVDVLPGVAAHSTDNKSSYL